MPVLFRLGDRRDAVIRAEGDDVAVAANPLVEMLQQLADPPTVRVRSFRIGMYF